MLPGGGLSVQKVPLGVTVRQIQYINDTSISTPTHPLYVMLISKEVVTDQSHLFDDGLTAEEQAKQKEEKEKEKIKRQVEADLGGFDLEQEWVEEIERENCFEIEKKYGGVPTLETHKYEIWVCRHHICGKSLLFNLITNLINIASLPFSSSSMHLLGKQLILMN